MREDKFMAFLEQSNQITSKNKAVRSRISRAIVAETILNNSLDYIVTDDDRMYEALMRIGEDPREKNGNIQNAVRWYYKFVNGKEFPRLAFYALRNEGLHENDITFSL